MNFLKKYIIYLATNQYNRNIVINKKFLKLLKKFMLFRSALKRLLQNFCDPKVKILKRTMCIKETIIHILTVPVFMLKYNTKI